ncbi:LysM domain-containing protein [Burkholderia ubonensis]|uniref:LysM peptidoglycan-binding domain-containing protein n=1 Tax=Burkholderia ubonensis TaxID=101571 RepID=UPI002FC2C355
MEQQTNAYRRTWRSGADIAPFGQRRRRFNTAVSLEGAVDDRISQNHSAPQHSRGVGYLLMKMANYEYRSIPAADSRIYEVVVKPGDNLDKIAKAQGSTVDTLKKLNPMTTVLRPGQVLKYHKASVQRVITSWRSISTTSIAQRYNGGGDPNYATKLDYVLLALRQGKTATCEQ